MLALAGRKGVSFVALAAALATACAAQSEQLSPQQSLDAYATALQQGRTQDAYALLSAEAKKEIPYESFQRIVRENPDEVRDIARSLGNPASPPRVTAVVTAPSGEALLLVYEEGAWRVDGSAIDLYGQSTPDAALHAFVRAFRNRRYDVLLRFIPDAEREGLGVAELKRAWEGEERADLERLVSAVETALPTSRLEVTGDRATMAFGAAGTVELVRERGVWKVEDLK
ncbi:MAG TPA: hypothetical protein VF103_00985 [Polyangiaceae bacterium]